MRETSLIVLLLGLGALPAAGATDCKPLPNPNPKAGAQLGCSVYIHDGVVALGANLDGAGSVTLCLLGRDPVDCRTTLKPSDGRPGDEFGRAVSMDGGWLAVGAPFADSSGAAMSGVVYLFREEDGRWVEKQKIFAADATRASQFGIVLSMQGGTLWIGAPFDSPAGSLSGSAYVFRLNGSSWVQLQKITAIGEQPFDNFGFSVALDGDTAVVGAPFQDGPAGGNSGAAYVFERKGEGEVWVQQTRLTASDGAADDQYGSAVAVSGNSLSVGTRGDNANRGSAYVYARPERGASWSETAHFFGEAPGDRFGVAASMSGTRLLVGALLHDGNGSESGAAYLFERNRSPDGTLRWEPVGAPISGERSGDRFGQAVSIQGKSLVVGAYLADVDSNRDVGSATVCSPRIEPPVLSCEKSGPTSVQAGEKVTYTVTVTNSGTTPVAGVMLADQPTPQLAFEPAPADRCQKLPCLLDTLLVGSSVSVPLTFRVPEGCSAPAAIKNQATVSGTGAEDASCPPVPITTTVLRPPPDPVPSCMKQGPISAKIGDLVTYEITVSNGGCGPAKDLTLTDRAMTGMTYVSGPCVLSPCSLGTIGPGPSSLPPKRVTFQVAPGCRDSVTDTATVSRNDVEVATCSFATILPDADLAVTLSAAAEVQGGASLPVSVVVSNGGPHRAQGVAVDVTVEGAAAVESLPAAADCALTPGQPIHFICHPKDVDCGGSTRLDFTVRAPSCAVGAPPPIKVSVKTEAAAPDPNPANNSAKKSTAVLCCGLSISKTDGLETAMPGQTLFYTITASNSGPSLPEATVTDHFPMGLTMVRWCRDMGGPPCTPSQGGDLQETISLPSGGSAVYRVQGSVDFKLAAPLSNTATVTGPPGCAASATDVTQIGFTGVKAFCTNIQGNFAPGGMITYTFVLLNGGPAAQLDNPGHEFTDVLPATLTLTGVSADSGTAAFLGNTATWNGPIPVGGMVMITVTATINLLVPLGTIICNQATIAFDADGNGSNESIGVSDDPGQPGPDDPCCFQVSPAIPALSRPGLVLLALVLAALALARLRLPGTPPARCRGRG